MSGIKSYIEKLSEKENALDDLVLGNSNFLTSEKDKENTQCFCIGPEKGETKCPCQLKSPCKKQ